MPADRTTPSFAAAAASAMPLSSHGPNHAPSLARGNACILCRQRKIKCDGVRPSCSACRKSALAHGEDPGSVVCNFDETERAGEGRKRTAGKSKVAALEAKIAELERIVENAQQQQQQPQISQPSHGVLNSASSYNSDPRNMPQIGNLEALLQASASPSLNSRDPYFTNSEVPYDLGGPSSSLFHLDMLNATAASSSQQNMRPMMMDTDPASPHDELLELFYPGWPNDLPSPTLVSRLVDVYFSKTHASSDMVNKRKFLAALQLPPTHHGFPHTALIHAMLATAARVVSSDFFIGEDFYWLRKGEPDETAADYHARKAKLEIDQAIGKGQKLFHVLQATVLICFYAYNSARFVEVWLYCGLATRMATPLGLNHIRAAGDETAVPVWAKASLLPATNDEEDLFERAATFYFAVTCDRFASASTGWASSLDDQDITSLLPAPFPAYPTEDLSTSPLSTHNPNFLVSHPPHQVQTLQLYFKAVVLLGRVTAFLPRAPAPIGVGLPPSSRQGFRNEKFDLRNTEEFKRLDSDAVTFRLSIPREYQSTQQTVPDSRISLVFAVPHVTTILLHESFCTMEEGDVSFARCLQSATAILKTIYSIWSTSFEIGLLAPFLHYCWAVAGRTLVRELALKQSRQQTSELDQIRSNVVLIINVMKACRSPLGDTSAASLQTLLDSPEICLPISAGGKQGSRTCIIDEAILYPPPRKVYPSTSQAARPLSGYSFTSSSASSASYPVESPSAFPGISHLSPYQSSNSETTSPGANGAQSSGASPSASAATGGLDLAALMAQAGQLPDQAAMFSGSENALKGLMDIPLGQFQWQN